MTDLSTKAQAETYITDRIDEAVGYTTAGQVLFDQFMDSLGNAANSLADVPFAEAGLLDLTEYVPETLRATLPTFDGVGTIDIDMPTMLNYVPISPFGEVSIPEAPSAIDTPSSSIAYVENDYISTLLDELKGYLQTGLLGSTGMSADVEQAIYGRDLTRREVEHSREYINTLNRYSAIGHDLHPGALSAALQRVENDKTRGLADHSKDVMVQASNLEQENKKNIMQFAVQLESVMVDHNDKVQARALDVAKTSAQLALDVWATSWERYKNLMQAAEIEARVNIAKLEGEATTNKAIGDQNMANIALVKAETELELGKLNAEVSSFSASVDGFKATVEAYVAYEGAKSGAYESSVKSQTAQAEMVLKAASVNIEAVIAVRTLLLEAAKSGANVSAQVLASALNSVNAGVSYGFSGSISSNYGYSYDQTKGNASGATTSNVHTWDET